MQNGACSRRAKFGLLYTRSEERSCTGCTLVPNLRTRAKTIRSLIRDPISSYLTTGREPRWWAGLLWLLIACIITILFFARLPYPRYTPDSWAYLELSKTVFGDFYRFVHLRSFWTQDLYSSAFPPLWPTLIATAHAFFGYDVRNQYVLAFAAFGAFVWLSELTIRRAFESKWVGASTAILLIAQPGFVGELTGGRSIPLQLLLYALLLYVLVTRPVKRLRDGLYIGVIAGLAVMNRFDALPFTAAIILMVAVLSRSVAVSMIAFAGVLAILSPWIAYSLNTFGVPFATDSRDVALAVDENVYATDWWPEKLTKLSDDPIAWVVKVSRNLLPFLRAGVLSLGFLLPLGVGLLLLLNWLISRTSSIQKNFATSDHERDRFRVLIGFLMALWLSTSANVVTGYFDSRYFAAVTWLTFTILFISTQWRLALMHHRAIVGFLFLGASCLLAALGVARAIAILLISAPWVSGSFANPIIDRQIRNCIAPDSRILVVDNNTLASRMGALQDIPSLMIPQNLWDGRLDPEKLSDFITSFSVRYVYLASGRIKPERLKAWGFSPFCMENLFARDPR